MRLPQISVLWLKLFYRKRRDESALCITNTGYDLCAKTAPNNFPGGGEILCYLHHCRLQCHLKSRQILIVREGVI